MPTKFDDLYASVFGGSCSKEGEAFERFAAAVTQLVYPEADVAHNQKLRGQVSNSLYQIDVLSEQNGSQVFGEAKDYTVQGKKVGRGDLQKLAGAMLEVEAEKAYFYSATDYTKPAKQYAQGSADFLKKQIELLHIRQSVEEDERGRIRKVVINMSVSLPDQKNSKFTPVWADSTKVTLRAWMENKDPKHSRGVLVDILRDAQGMPKLTIFELTSQGYGGGPDTARACFLLRDHYVSFDGMLLEIIGLEYEIPYVTRMDQIEIDVSGSPQILVRSESGEVNKLITLEQLRRISFGSDGSVTLRPAK